ncbi:MAG TPA: hypothetical protein VGP04_22610 [Pseudonocardiaceae bacterium]|nr:hypothetical protein [Pseudonocardiaceae bacterium]
MTAPGVRAGRCRAGRRGRAAGRGAFAVGGARRDAAAAARAKRAASTLIEHYRDSPASSPEF